MTNLPVITSDDLDGTLGFTIVGPGGQIGWGIAPLGDVNGDGKTDFIVSTAGTTALSYVIFGGTTFGTTFDLANLDGTNGFAFTSGGSDEVGGLDINGDGLSDMVIGKYVVFGSASGFSATVSGKNLNGTDGFELSSLPSAIAPLGDFNGDGVADLLIAYQTQGRAAVIYGQASGWSAKLNLDDLNGTNGFLLPSPTPDIAFPSSARSAGDFNGDGKADLIIGAPSSEVGHGFQTGAAYVVFGQSGIGASFDVNTLNGSNGFMIVGAEGASRLGWSMGRAGDVNGDGYDDIIVQATDADPVTEREGSTYLLFGGPGGFPAVFDLETINGINGVRIDGNSFRGQAMDAATGDFNGDGYADIAIGSPDRTPEGVEYGPEHAYVIFGRPDWQRTINVGMLDGSNGFTFDGGVGSNDVGRFVEFADVNGDGYDDLMVAAPRIDSLAGDVSVVYGHPTGPLTPFVDSRQVINGTEGNDNLSGTAASETLNGLGGDDVFEWSGGGDQYRGDAGFDTVSYAAAPSAVKVKLGPGSSPSGSAAGDTFLSIERVIGTSYADQITGDHDDNQLWGGDRRDKLSGLRGNDLLIGGLGRDILTGGEGQDVFSYKSIDDSPVTVNGYDKITDFVPGEDKIDLGQIDADPTMPDNQALAFIGYAEFHQIAGELRAYSDTNTNRTWVEADVTGDGVADFKIELVGAAMTLTAGNFIV